MPFLYSWVPPICVFSLQKWWFRKLSNQDGRPRQPCRVGTCTVTRLPNLLHRVQPLLVQSLPPTLCTTTPVTISHSHIVYQPALLAYILYHLNSCPTLCPTLPLFGLRNYRVCVSSNGPQIQIHRLHPVPSTFALLVPSLHQPLPTPTNPWTCSCTRYICLSTFSTSQTTQGVPVRASYNFLSCYTAACNSTL